jgi:hypothetical protein
MFLPNFNPHTLHYMVPLPWRPHYGFL